MTFQNPGYLVTTSWLAAHINDPSIRVIDCTVFLRAPSPGADRRSYVQESGRAMYELGHIPGALFADLVHDLSKPGAAYPFTRPSADQFARAMSSLGISNETRVVCYDAAGSMWATRAWWLLRSFGHDRASVLDGGWKKWVSEGRPSTSVVPQVEPTSFTPSVRKSAWAEKEEVLEIVTSGGGCVVNALSPEQHAGGSAAYGRRGHITGSMNIAARDLVDPVSGAFLPEHELRERFKAIRPDGGRVIMYCGGGIAATADAFALTLLGHENVAVYDNSLSEWARNEALPMT